MLFVEGRASAILEEYEQTQGGNQLTYAALAQKLRDHFDSAETRENSMSMFEGRIQKVNETEEEFMLDLLKLYQTANPDHAAAVTLLAVKRKFLAGIAPVLKTCCCCCIYFIELYIYSALSHIAITSIILTNTLQQRYINLFYYNL